MKKHLLSAMLLFAVVCSSCAQSKRAFIANNVDFAQRQYRYLLAEADKNPQSLPRTTNGSGVMQGTNIYDWTSGFFPGCLWYLYELSGDAKWIAPAQRWTKVLAPIQNFHGHHDVGFMIYCSYGNGVRLGKDSAYNSVIVQTSKSLLKRYNAKVGCIQSWDVKGWQGQRGWKYPVIIDNMMNLEMLFYATKITGDSSFFKVAVSHAEFLNRSFSNFSKSSNWGILEFQGLFNVAVFMSEFKQSDVWLKDALQNLETCAGIQVLPDGTQWEQSPMYHNEVFHCLMNVVMLGKKANIAIPELIRQKAYDMAWANVKWQKPNYHQPLIGDSDDTDLRGLLTLAAWLYNDGGLKSRAYPELDYETSFLLGEGQKLSYQKIEAHSPQFLSIYQPSSGDMFMRDSWNEGAHYLQLHLKKVGCGHAHDDLLHLSLFANNRDYLVDGGRYTYEDWKEREQLKMSTGHNGLGVDDLTNSVYDGSWDNRFNAKTEEIYTQTTPLYDYAEAENTGYHRLADPVSMTRRVLYLKPGLWLVFDRFAAKESHKYSQYFSFPDKQVRADSDRVTTTYGKDDLVVEAVKPVAVNLKDSKWSPEYNLLKENLRAEFSTSTKGSHSFITALYFTGQNKTVFTQIPVYDRNNVKLNDSIVEAVEVKNGDKEYLVMVVNNRQSPKSAFYKIKGLYVTGEVVMFEKDNDRYIKHIVKE